MRIFTILAPIAVEIRVGPHTGPYLGESPVIIFQRN